GRTEELIARRAQLVERVAGAILEHEAEAARHTESLDRRRVEREHHRLLDPHQRAERLVHERDRIVLLTRPLVPRLQAHERHRVRLALTEEAETAREDRRRHLGLGAIELLHLLDRQVRALGRGARGSLYHGEHGVLILDREEAAGQAPEQKQRDEDQTREDGEEAERANENAADDVLIAAAGARE